MLKNAKTRYAPVWVRKPERIAFLLLLITISLVPIAQVALAQSATDTGTTTASSSGDAASSTDTTASDTEPMTPDQPYVPTPPRELMTIPTYVGIAICGNGITDPGEVCDDGALKNDGAYGTSTATRHCSPDCHSFGPYCGDGTLEPYYSEECDDGAENGTNQMCSLDCKQLIKPISSTTPPNPPPTPSGNGGSDGNTPMNAQTQVNFTGWAYPGARVQILKDGELNGMSQCDANGRFTYQVSNATPGPTTFGFWAEDAKKIRSITFTSTFQVTQNAATNVDNVLLPPTIRSSASSYKPGSTIKFDGSTVPNALVNVLEGKARVPSVSATSTGSGSWSADLSTQGMVAEIFHQFVPNFQQLGADGVTRKSGSGASLNLFVGNNGAISGPSGSADLNHDSKVNFADFSILLFHWGTNDSTADLNHDGKVNIADLSIMLYQWTG